QGMPLRSTPLPREKDGAEARLARPRALQSVLHLCEREHLDHGANAHVCGEGQRFLAGASERRRLGHGTCRWYGCGGGVRNNGACREPAIEVSAGDRGGLASSGQLMRHMISSNEVP